MCLTEHDKSDPNYIYPTVITDLILQIPNILITPSLEEIQGCVTKIMYAVLSVLRKVPRWGQLNVRCKKKSVGELNLVGKQFGKWPCFFHNFV